MTYPGAMTAVWDGTVAGAPVRQPGPVNLAFRLLAALGLVLGWAQLSTMPVTTSLDELFAELDRGDVTRITLERPHPAAAASGDFRVRWDGAGRPGEASYRYESELVGSEARVLVDEAQEIRAAATRSPAAVAIVEVRDFSYGGTTWFLHGIAWFVALLVLVTGPQPRLATKWAWGWLLFLVPPAALALVVLEPVPLWRREARWRARRLTGGWALLLAVVAAGVLEGTSFGELFV